tara:strand:+ start:15885 stop:16943 length:1059 start_codon:yes stop_codon:yes gene_type:complete
MNAFHTLPALLLGAVLVGQIDATFPSDHAVLLDGQGSQNWFPYSYGVSRMQAVYEAWDLNIPAGNQITRIGFRANGTTIAYGESLNLQILMGQTDETADSLTNNFAANYFGAPTTVFGPGLFQMPDLNNVLNPNPDGPYIWVNLTTPFTFDPSKNLLVEWRVLANSNGGASFPYTLDRAAFVSPITTGPAGCQHSGGQTPSLTSQPTKVGGTWYNNLSQGPGNQPVILFINVGTQLAPQFPLATVFAGVDPSCFAQVSPVALFSLSGTTGNTGYKSFSVPIPDNLAFNNFVISSQAFCFDFFSPGGLVVSNGDQVEIGADPAMSVLWNQGNATAPTGNVYRNYGVVTLFTHN